MGTYNIPRNVKGEGRFFYIFSVKSLIYMAGGAVIGLPFYLIFSLMGMKLAGIIIVAFFGLLAFLIATFKFPEIGIFKFTKKISGQNIDDILTRAIKFKRKGRKIYLYTKEEKKNG